MITEADKRYKKSPKGIEARKRYDRSEVGKAKYSRYRAKPEYKEYARKRYAEMPINIKKARYYLHNAIRDKKIIKPNMCEKCGKQTRIEGHHYMGYEPQYWLTVKWLCPSCHRGCDAYE